MNEEADFKDREAFDDSERELCPDGNCTGLIGSDGRCKVCGLRADGSRPATAPAADEHEADAPVGALAIEGDVDDRQLCPDGACIGLIGSDGKCKVCGRSAAS